MRKRIAVVGAGIYGVTIALQLAKKHDVTLYEQYPDIFRKATGINQFRLHKGYHYPRSPETITSCKKDEALFKEEYPKSILGSFDHYYCIAKEKSLTSGKQFLKMCEEHGLDYKTTSCPVVDQGAVDLTVKVSEYLVNPFKLYEESWQKLKKSSVRVLLKTKATRKIVDNYDKVIVCTYSTINSLIPNGIKKKYQYELCEKIAVKLPDSFKNQSVVIMDGPFTCVDPYANTGLHLMGNVVHAIHATNVGYFPRYPKKFKKVLNNGLIKNPPITNFAKFIDSAKTFFPKIAKAKHMGSMYTFRAVLPNKEKTDERLPHINKVNDKISTVFAGKLACCVECAGKLEDQIS